MKSDLRSRTGCLVCRLRKKKCDEQRPSCQACRKRQLVCYGYEKPIPSWASDELNWEQVKNSIEAKNLRALAETHYKVSRKIQSRSGPKGAIHAIQDDERSTNHEVSEATQLAGSHGLISTLSTLTGNIRISNIWQLQPDTIWWDGRFNVLTVDNALSARRDTRALIIFKDIIHPITHTFYHLSTSKDQNWFLNRIVSNEALYYAALSVSACFEHSRTQPAVMNEIGINSKVRNLQSASVRKLREEVEAYTVAPNAPSPELVLGGVRLVDVIFNLANLEIFSMLQGCWEMHHHAARAIFNHIELSTQSKCSPMNMSLIRNVLQGMSCTDDRQRTLKFCVTNFIWIDVLATATFGLSSYAPCAFDFIPMLEAGEVRPEDVMGCRGVLEVIAKIARLEQRWLMSRRPSEIDCADREILLAYQCLSTDLKRIINHMEYMDTLAIPIDTNHVARDVTLISIIWAYAARIYLQYVVSIVLPANSHVDQQIVKTCLQWLERLPTRLVSRICWPYTIAGCMSLEESDHQKFRFMLARTMQERQAPGVCWKGLLVMEECWRLRDLHGHAIIGWREAMESLNARVLLV